MEKNHFIIFLNLMKPDFEFRFEDKEDPLQSVMTLPNGDDSLKLFGVNIIINHNDFSASEVLPFVVLLHDIFSLPFKDCLLVGNDLGLFIPWRIDLFIFAAHQFVG